MEDAGIILEWILNWDLKTPINELPSEQICDILIIVYLFQNECISGFEAVWIFQNTLKMAKEGVPKKNAFYQKTVSGRALRVSQLFLEFKTFFVACLSSIGLEYLAVSFFKKILIKVRSSYFFNSQNEITFDSVHFQKMMLKHEPKKLNKFTADQLLEKMAKMISYKKQGIKN
jgi:hypothetical protein